MKSEARKLPVRLGPNIETTPKHEIQNPLLLHLVVSNIRASGFEICFGFRISDFGFSRK